MLLARASICLNSPKARSMNVASWASICLNSPKARSMNVVARAPICLNSSAPYPLYHTHITFIMYRLYIRAIYYAYAELRGIPSF